MARRLKFVANADSGNLEQACQELSRIKEHFLILCENVPGYRKTNPVNLSSSAGLQVITNRTLNNRRLLKQLNKMRNGCNNIHEANLEHMRRTKLTFRSGDPKWQEEMQSAVDNLRQSRKQLETVDEQIQAVLFFGADVVESAS